MKFSRAIKEVEEGTLSIRRAALEYGIPRATPLHDRYSGKVQASQSGPPRYLSDSEEDELVRFLESCSNLGYGRSKKEILSIVQAVVLKKGMEVQISHGWWDSFRKRHPEVVLRAPEPLSYVRLAATQQPILEKYCDLLQCTLEEYGLMNKPTQIYNLDESGVPLDTKPPLIATKHGQKHPCAPVTGDRKQISVLACCSAAGYCLPPFVVFKRKTLSKEMCDGEVPGTMYGLSENGWVDSELFDLWFNKHFLPNAIPTRPLLLIMDGASSHLNPITIEKAAKEDVLLFCLPPHSTHKTQPLDKGCFWPLKAAWRQECHNYLTQNPGKVVTQYQFSRLFKNAWVTGMTMKNIISGFKVTGIYPFDPSVINPQPSTSSESDSESRPNGSGRLHFLPLTSPMPCHIRKSFSMPNMSILVEDSNEEEAQDLNACTTDLKHSGKPHSTALDKVLSCHQPTIKNPSTSKELCSSFDQ